MRINIGFCESEGIGEHSVVSGDNVGSDFLNDFHAVNNFTEGGVFTVKSLCCTEHYEELASGRIGHL